MSGNIIFDYARLSRDDYRGNTPASVSGNIIFEYERFSRDESIGELHLPLCQVRLCLTMTDSTGMTI